MAQAFTGLEANKQSSIPEYNGSPFKEGFFELSTRAAGFENLLAANVLFIPVSSNSFRPFLTGQHLGTDGKFHLPISQKEFEDSQK